MKTRHRSVTRAARRGLSLIELSACLVLLSILLVAITGVIPRFTARAQDRTALDEAVHRRAAQQALNRIARDLVSAEAVIANQTVLRLIPDIECVPVLDDADPRSSTVVDTLSRLEDRTYLMRHESGRRELLFGGAFRLTIQPAADDGTGLEPIVLGNPTEITEPTERRLPGWTELTLLGPTGAVLARTTVVREPVPVDVLEVFEATP